MREGSLFSGYGGLGMAAADVLGTEPAWFVDHDPAATAVLAHHWPEVPNLGDITAIDWHTVEPVDVLTAGWPCQDLSNAGNRAGMAGEHSGLWRHVADAVRVLRPRYVLLENVSAVVVRGLDTVLADLAALGFAAEWTTLRASEVGACHRRDRWFLAATTDTTGDRRDQRRAEHARQLGRSDVAERDRIDWGHYETVIRRWETVIGRSAPTPTVAGRGGRDVLNPALSEWMIGLPAGWITDVPDLSRNQQLRLTGNGVVPHQAAAAFEYMLPLLDGAEMPA